MLTFLSIAMFFTLLLDDNDHPFITMGAFILMMGLIGNDCNA